MGLARPGRAEPGRAGLGSGWADWMADWGWLGLAESSPARSQALPSPVQPSPAGPAGPSQPSSARPVPALPGPARVTQGQSASEPFRVIQNQSESCAVNVYV